MNVRILCGCAAIALAFLLPRASAITFTFGPRQAPDYLDITLDVSDGHWIQTGPTTRSWVIDGPPSVTINHQGWTLQASAVTTGFGSFPIDAPVQFGFNFNPFAGLGYIYTQSVISDPNGISTLPLWSLAFGMWNTPFSESFNPPLPVVTSPTIASHKITWNVKDGGTTAVMLGAMGMMLLFRRHRAFSKSQTTHRG